MMTHKKALFVREYLIDLNATQAAIRAGYSKRSAGVMGSRLLEDVEIRETVRKVQAERAAKVGVTAEEVLADIRRVTKAAEDAGRYGEALKGLELTGKHLKLFTDKHELSGPGGAPLSIVIDLGEK